MSAGPIGCLNVERSLGGLDLNRMLLLPRHQGLGLERPLPSEQLREAAPR